MIMATNNWEDFSIEHSRKDAHARRKKLHDYHQGYTIEMLLKDLEIYFDGEVDFNYEKIQEFLQLPGKFEQLIKRANDRNTHPVSEFIQDMVKDATDKKE